MFDEDGIPDELNRLSNEVIGAAISVHRHLGPGYVEAAYRESLSAELSLRGIPFQREVGLEVFFKGMKVCTHRLDFLIDERLVVEIKAVETLLQVHRAQVLAYLKAGAFPLGLLINFHVSKLVDGVRRLIWRSPDEYADWVARKWRSR